jgi:DNA-binding NarL/FixJ family response regulator
MILDASAESAAETRFLLEKAGLHVVEWASSGTGWITGWQRAKPEVVVIDLQLPKRDGLHCLGKLKELDASVKVLFTHSYSGACANEAEWKALSLGASAVLQRPASAARFLAVLDGVAEQARRDRALLRPQNR